MLGHTNINTTQIYARVTEDKINNEMNALAENITELETKLSSGICRNY
jgi:site-specific recombinase XerC